MALFDKYNINSSFFQCGYLLIKELEKTNSMTKKDLIFNVHSESKSSSCILTYSLYFLFMIDVVDIDDNTVTLKGVKNDK